MKSFSKTITGISAAMTAGAMIALVAVPLLGAMFALWLLSVLPERKLA